MRLIDLFESELGQPTPAPKFKAPTPAAFMWKKLMMNHHVSPVGPSETIQKWLGLPTMTDYIERKYAEKAQAKLNKVPLAPADTSMTVPKPSMHAVSVTSNTYTGTAKQKVLVGTGGNAHYEYR